MDVYAKRGTKGDIFYNAIIDGMIGYARNSMVKKFIAEPVSIGSGQHLSLRKLWSTFLDIEKTVQMY